MGFVMARTREVPPPSSLFLFFFVFCVFFFWCDAGEGSSSESENGKGRGLGGLTKHKPQNSVLPPERGHPLSLSPFLSHCVVPSQEEKTS